MAYHARVMPWCQVTRNLLGTDGNDGLDLQIAAVCVLCAVSGNVAMQHVMHTAAMDAWKTCPVETAQYWLLYYM